MRIVDLLTENTMVLDLQSTTKDPLIDELVDQLDQAGKLNDKHEYKKAILAREEQSSTGIGEGIAIPHAKSAAVNTPAIAFGRSKQGAEYDALDGQPAHLFFMIAASEGANEDHLQALSRLSTLLMDESFRRELMEAETKADILKAVNRKEDEKTEAEAKEQTQSAKAGESEGREGSGDSENSEDSNDNKEIKERKESVNGEGRGKILAVTGCPTGIAHTYMAADKLKDTAREMGIEIKVETNGSDGVKNRLSSQEIEQAPAIIVAADTKVELDRFQGKPVIQAGVTDGIRHPEDLLKRAVKKEAPVFDGEASANSDNEEQNERKGFGFYKHLMNGVSNMLPFVVGGGILIAISFMFGIEAADPDHPDYHPIAEALSIIGGDNAFGLMIPVLAAFIAMSIADRPGFAPGMVAGLMASTGEAGFLGGIIAGFLAGYIVIGLKRVFAGLPESLNGIKTILLYPLFGILVSGALMLGVIIEPVSALNSGLENWLAGMGTGNMLLLGVILGGMMAVDMGGPINKAAFTFGIAMIDAGNFGPHAAVMAGGMVPPLGIALATTFFKNRFTNQEQEAGKTNYVMGASFITEGAIPFAAADPGRVIPSIVVGSALAGAITMLFGVGLPAPHGGAFVIGIVEGNPLLYVLAIAIGAIVTALLLGLFKKPIDH